MMTAVRYTQADVDRAFERYVRLTGDLRASLQAWAPGDRYGTRYEVINATTTLARKAACGAEHMYRIIHAFCDGYEAGYVRLELARASLARYNDAHGTISAYDTVEEIAQVLA